MLDFIKYMADESPVILVILIITMAGMVSTFADMIVNIFRVCVGG